MSTSRVGARVARRELRRRPVTTLLVALLVAAPVAAMVVGVVLVRTQPLSAEQQQIRQVGAAQASVSVMGDAADAATATILAAAPGASIVRVDVADGSVRSSRGEDIDIRASGGPFTDRLVAPRYVVSEGELPHEAGEVALSPDAAAALGVTVGDTVALPELGTTGRVVGLASTLGRSDPEIFVASLATLDPATVSAQLFIDQPGGIDGRTVASLREIAAGGRGWLEVRPELGDETSAGGYRFEPRVQTQADTELYVASIWGLGALALVVMAIVISAAFAIGARRQLRTLGLLAANGAPPSVLRSTVRWQGLWLGIVGTAAGIGIGIGGLALLRPRAATIFAEHHPSQLVWNARDLVPIAVLGVLTSVAAALVPARTASNVGVLHALAGRRPLAPMRPRVVVVGALAAAAGLGIIGLAIVGSEVVPESAAVWTSLGVVGGMAVLGGAVVASPLIVAATGSLAERVRGSAHLAVRSVGRQRSRYGSVVAGIAAVTALLLALTSGMRSSDVVAEQQKPNHADHVVIIDAMANTASAPDLLAPSGATVIRMGSELTPVAVSPDQLDQVHRVLPDAVRVDAPVATTFPSLGTTRQDPDVQRYIQQMNGIATLATPELLDGLHVPDDVRAVLDRGVAVALAAPPGVTRLDLTKVEEPQQGAESGDLTLAALDRQPERRTIDVAPFPDVAVDEDLPDVLLPLATARSVGFDGELGPNGKIFFFTPRPLTDAERSAVNQLFPTSLADRFRLAGATTADRAGAAMPIVWAGRSPTPASQSVATAWLSGVGLVFTAVVVGLGLALAARDNRDERDVLEAVGAPPALLRRVGGLRAALLALLGAVVAVPTGLLPVLVIDLSSRPATPFAIPWITVVAVLVVIPVVIGLGAWVGGALTSWRRPLSASRFAAD